MSRFTSLFLSLFCLLSLLYVKMVRCTLLQYEILCARVLICEVACFVVAHTTRLHVAAIHTFA